MKRVALAAAALLLVAPGCASFPGASSPCPDDGAALGVELGRGKIAPTEGAVAQRANGYADGRFDLSGASRSGRPHRGVDIVNGEGEPVCAAAAGRIGAVYELLKDSGYQVVVEHPGEGRATRYFHLQEKPADLHAGDTVDAGDAIARVGSTGNADPCCPHLHFEVRSGWSAVNVGTAEDPLRWLEKTAPGS